MSPHAVYELSRPTADAPATPLVFTSPHSGRVIPQDMGAGAQVTRHTMALAEDAFVSQLVASGPRRGACLLEARYSRSYLDLNRAPTDFDPLLIDDVHEAVGPKTAAGYGVIPRLAGDGTALYDRKLSRAEAEARVSGAHSPYHDALKALMVETRETHGHALLVDWHSMPSRATGVEVVIGDRHGSSCSAAVSRRLRGLFEDLGWRVSLNLPYAGGWTTRTWGRPEEGFEAIQIELNRALYLDETTLEPNSRFPRTLKALERVIQQLCATRWSN